MELTFARHLLFYPISMVSLVYSALLFANTPSEMADLSLQELFALSTDEMDEKVYDTWQFNLRYRHSTQDGYLDGSTSLSYGDVLYDGQEPRTNDNYPILPTVITQKAVISTMAYHFNSEQNVSLSLPYIHQSTDHLSIVPGYDAFNISSEGIGDVTVNYSNVISNWDTQKVTFLIGVSIPTGSIDEQGDTPRAIGDQQLPYTMQLGSGTFDLPLGISYSQDKGTYSWGVNSFAKVRIGKNDRDYRLGNSLAFSTWSKWYLNEFVHPQLKLVFQDWGSIRGQDDEITVPNPMYPYPAGITNPRNYGGQKLSIAIGGDFFIGDQMFTIEAGAPFYQNLNGVQPKEKFNISFNWQG